MGRFLRALIIFLAAFTMCATTAHAADSAGQWVRPVPGQVLRPFQPPATKYGPGHVGVDFAAPAGTPVHAAGDGQVTFAGQVGGALHVVILHPNGLRTSYSFLHDITVHVGESLHKGDVVGHSGGSDPTYANAIFFGLRFGDQYLDPMLLFQEVDLTKVVHLADLHQNRGHGAAAPDDKAALEKVFGNPASFPSAFMQKLGAAPQPSPSWWDRLTGTAKQGAQLMGKIGLRMAQLTTGTHSKLQNWLLGKNPLYQGFQDAAEIGSRLWDWVRNRLNCTPNPPAADGTGGDGHLVIGVAGITSSWSGSRKRSPFHAPVLERLGYAPDEIDYFSYNPKHGPSYSAKDTFTDLHNQAENLGKQLQKSQQQHPGQPVDLIAHSQGGVVVQEFLKHVYNRNDPAYPPIGKVITFSSPNEGAPAATEASETNKSPTGRAATDGVKNWLDTPPQNAPSVQEMSENSPFIKKLKNDPLPEGIDFVSISAADDVLVPATNTSVRGGHELTVNPKGGPSTEHHNILENDTALSAARLALAGEPPPCIAITDGIHGAIAPVVITQVEHGTGTAISGSWWSDWLMGPAGPVAAP